MWEWMRGMDVYYIKCLVGVSLISIIILLIRFFLGKKLSKRFTYGMWIAIPVFLILVPWVRIPMPQGMVNFSRETWEKLEGEVYTIVLPEDVEIEEDTLAEVVQGGELFEQGMEGSETVPTDDKVSENREFGMKFATIFAKCLVVLYSLVVVGILAGIISTNAHFEHRCRHNRVYLGETPKSKLPVYCLEGITSPFLLCATMYVPVGMTEEELRYAMLHEEGHFKHGDFFWVITRYFILAVFFYNPIVWLAFKYSGYDCELACDESVMRRIKVAEYKDYGGCLLDVIKKHRGLGQRVLLSTNMKAPKKLIRARIENIVARRKNNVLLAGLAVLLVVVVTGCGFMEQRAEVRDILVSVDSDAEEKENLSDQIQEEVSGANPSGVEPQGGEKDGENRKPQGSDNVVDYGDTVYFCARIMKKETDGTDNFSTIEDKHELCAKINQDVISFEKTSSLAMEMISYVAKEAVGKKKGDTIQLIRELNGAEYHYFYMITAINDEMDLGYSFPEGWGYEFPEPVVGQFYNAGKDKPDFGFDGRELENGEFFVPYMREYYTVATASSYLDPVGENGYHPGNVTGHNKMCAWAEGVEGTGIGETIELRQMYMGPGEDVLIFTQFCIVNGYAKNKDIWEKNARVKELKVYYGDTYVGNIQLKDCMEPQYIDVSSLNMTVANGREAAFRFEIADVYPGSKYEDTCLTGILIDFSR